MVRVLTNVQNVYTTDEDVVIDLDDNLTRMVLYTDEENIWIKALDTKGVFPFCITKKQAKELAEKLKELTDDWISWNGFNNILWTRLDLRPVQSNLKNLNIHLGVIKMKAFIQTILICLLACCVTMLMFFGMDITVANRDYIRLSNNSDYEQKIEGCLFDYVCNYYNEKLWEK